MVECVYGKVAYLHMTLRLHEASHYPIGTKKAARGSVSKHGWDYSVVGPFLRTYTVHMTRVQREVSTSVLLGKERMKERKKERKKERTG